MQSDLYKYLSNKKIVLLGMGREGMSSLRFLERHKEEIGDFTLTAADSRPIKAELPEGTRVFAGENYLQAMEGADLVLKSPGISFKDFTKERTKARFYLKEFPGAEISGQMDLFLRFAPGHIVGVSGTKGKSTTTTLCHEILTAAYGEENCFLMGNIGVPVFEHIDELNDETYCAVELSSHQLEFCSASPEIGILTNFYVEHLDHYRSYEEYISAKMNLLRYQKAGDTAVLAAFEEELMTKTAGLVRGKMICVGDARLNNYAGRKADWELLEGRDFRCGGKLYLLPDNPAMLGRHVYRDALLAAAACSAAGVPPEKALEAMEGFKGIRHRLEPVGSYAGIRFYNDSIATIPQSCLFALEALDSLGRVTTLLAGGMDRGLDYGAFVKALYDTKLRQVITMPDTGSKVEKLLAENNEGRAAEEQIKAYPAQTMEEAVKLAYELTKKGEICLLSPAASSYNLYKNFEERGDCFKEAVRRLGAEYEGKR